jgi:hypothetical protein
MSGERPVGASAARFDGQAASFDRRAGLPREPAASIAAAVAATAPSLPGGVLLELGAGTGEIGARLVRSGGMPYVGVDLSLSMLARFRSRLRVPVGGGRGTLVQGDADRPWPLAGGRAGIVFVSRALHLLDLERVAAEVLACAHPQGCAVVVGRVRRAPASVRSMLRRQMRGLLAARGVTGRSGERAADRLGEIFAAHGGRTHAPRVVATWTVEERPAAILAGWRGKSGLAGVAVPPDLQARVLDELAAWARASFGNLEAPRAARDDYELTVIELSASGAIGGAGAANPVDSGGG